MKYVCIDTENGIGKQGRLGSLALSDSLKEGKLCNQNHRENTWKPLHYLS